ncbi:MAG: thioesterase domain-containing protein, partial [Cyanobacteriota bacterium]|nr:thioesterase domain-containing protein [Cyanobacteriota bacterium]
TDQGLRVVFEYNTDLFAESRIEQMLNDLQNVLENIAAKPDQSIDQLTRQIIVEESSVNGHTEYLSDNFVREQNDNLLTRTNQETPVPARNDVEAKLIEIWENLLNISPISVTDNFFAIGGSSLLAVKLFAEISQIFDQNYPLSILLKAPTIEELAVKLQEVENLDDEWSPLVEIQPQGSKPPLFCVHGGGFNVLIYRNLAIGLGEDYPVYGLQARGLDGKPFPVEQLEEIAADYIQEIQKIQPQGSYFLCGLSNGGNIALEMAQQLKAKGQNVAFLGLFDTYAPNSAGLLPPGQRLLSSIKYVLQYRVPYIVKNATNVDVLTKFKKIWNKLKKSRASSDTSSNVNPSKSHLKTTEKQVVITETNRWEYWMNQVSLYILKHSPWSFYAPSQQLKNEENEIANTLVSLEQNYSEVYKKYEPKPYLGQITLFRSEETPPGYYRDSHLGWNNIAQDGVELHVIPGHHTSMMKSSILFKKMKTCLEKVAADFNKS